MITNMGKIKKFTGINIRKITGGKDPIRAVEEFLLKLNINPDDVRKEKTSDHARWMHSLNDGTELEILLENIKQPAESTLYMGINVAVIPVRGGSDMLAAALEIADGLVGIKLSLVGHYLVLSATLGASDLQVDDLDYHFRLISAQRGWFLEALSEELGLAEEG